MKFWKTVFPFLLFGMDGMLIGNLYSPFHDDLPDTPPSIVSQPVLEYPKELKENKVSGKVILKLFVDEKGRVAEVEVVESSHPLFTEAALKGISEWKFKPASRDDKPMAMWTRLPIIFDPRDAKDKRRTKHGPRKFKKL